MIDSFENLKKLELDPVPKYLLHCIISDVNQNSFSNQLCTINQYNEDSKVLKNMMLESSKVTELSNLQWEDGSWGRFHSMDTSSKSDFTTEKALRKLLNMGLSEDDEIINNAVKYMEGHLDGVIELRDYREKKHDWDLLTELFVATWLLRIDSTNKKAIRIAEKWSEVIAKGFSKGSFCEQSYKTAYDTILKPKKGKEYWKIDNFYIVSILKGRLDHRIEYLFINHIMNNHRGIYYIYDKKLSDFPKETKGKSFVRYLNAISMILDYDTGYKHLEEIIKKLIILKDDEGFWDFGKDSKDNIALPLSENWRTEGKRKADCTILTLGLIKKYLNSIKGEDK